MAHKLMQMFKKPAPFAQNTKKNDDKLGDNSTIKELIQQIDKRLTKVEATLEELVKNTKG